MTVSVAYFLHKGSATTTHTAVKQQQPHPGSQGKIGGRVLTVSPASDQGKSSVIWDKISKLCMKCWSKVHNGCHTL